MRSARRDTHRQQTDEARLKTENERNKRAHELQKMMEEQRNKELMMMTSARDKCAHGKKVYVQQLHDGQGTCACAHGQKVVALTDAQGRCVHGKKVVALTSGRDRCTCDEKTVELTNEEREKRDHEEKMMRLRIELEMIDRMYDNCYECAICELERSILLDTAARGTRFNHANGLNESFRHESPRQHRLSHEMSMIQQENEQEKSAYEQARLSREQMITDLTNKREKRAHAERMQSLRMDERRAARKHQLKIVKQCHESQAKQLDVTRRLLSKPKSVSIRHGKLWGLIGEKKETTYHDAKELLAVLPELPSRNRAMVATYVDNDVDSDSEREADGTDGSAPDVRGSGN